MVNGTEYRDGPSSNGRKYALPSSRPERKEQAANAPRFSLLGRILSLRLVSRNVVSGPKYGVALVVWRKDLCFDSRLGSRRIGPRCALPIGMRGPWLLEVEFKVETQRLGEFNGHLEALRELSSLSARPESIFEDSRDTTSLLWMSEWASRELLIDFVRQDVVRELLGRMAACALITGCRVVASDKPAGPLRRGVRGIRQVHGQAFDLPGFSGPEET